MHINEKRRLNAFNEYNVLLKNNEQNLFIKNWKNNALLLSNNIFLGNRNDVRNFLNRCKSKITGKLIDYLYEDLDNIKSKLKKIRKEINSYGGKRCWELNKKTLLKNFSGEPWNKGLTKEIDDRIPSAWNKGLTKEIDDRLMKMSNDRIGVGNPMYGYKHSEEYKKKKSK